MMNILSSAVDGFQSALRALHDLLEPISGVYAWGWAIIALTLIIRVLLLPLAIKQIRSMRAMQALQPQIKELQKKYKVDRELLRKDPEQYRAKRQKMQQEQMALFQEHKVNPAMSCLPLLAQAPVFLALFRILQPPRSDALTDAPFYFFTSRAEDGLTEVVSGAGWPGWILIALMVGTMFVTQKQMMARQAASGADNPMAQQQKILLYVMPVFLAFISFQLPLGVLLYWVTTNLFQAVQQWFMLREVKQEAEDGTLGEHKGGEAANKPAPGTGGKRRSNPGASSGSTGDTASKNKGSGRGDTNGTAGKTSNGKNAKGSGKGSGKSGGSTPSSNGGRSSAKKRDHLPRRGDRR